MPDDTVLIALLFGPMEVFNALPIGNGADVPLTSVDGAPESPGERDGDD